MKKYAIMSLMAVLALGACDDDDEDPLGPSNSAEVRVVNASAGVPAVNVFRGNDQIAGGVAFQSAQSCSSIERVPTGNQTLQFRSTTNPAVTEDVSFNFVAGQRYTVVLYGPANNLQSAVILDEPTAGTATNGNNRLRFINAQPTAGDIFATVPGAATVTGTPTVAALGAGSGTTGTTMYRDIATGSTRFRLFNTGSTTNPPRGDYTLSATGFPTSRNATIVFTDAATGQTATGFQINNCT